MYRFVSPTIWCSCLGTSTSSQVSPLTGWKPVPPCEEQSIKAFVKGLSPSPRAMRFRLGKTDSHGVLCTCRDCWFWTSDQWYIVGCVMWIYIYIMKPAITETIICCAVRFYMLDESTQDQHDFSCRWLKVESPLLLAVVKTRTLRQTCFIVSSLILWPPSTFWQNVKP